MKLNETIRRLRRAKGLTQEQTARILGDAVETVEGVYTHLRQQRQKSAAEILAEYCK